MSKNQSKISVWKGVGQLWANFHVIGDVQRESFLHRYIGQWMPYNLVADSIYTNKLCSRLLSSEVQPFRGLRSNVQWSSWAHWKACSGLSISVS